MKLLQPRILYLLSFIPGALGCATAHQDSPTRVVLVTPANGAAGVPPLSIMQVHFSNGLRIPFPRPPHGTRRTPR